MWCYTACHLAMVFMGTAVDEVNSNIEEKALSFLGNDIDKDNALDLVETTTDTSSLCHFLSPFL